MSMPGFRYGFHCPMCGEVSDDYPAFVFPDIIEPRIVYGLMRYGLTYVKQTEEAYAEQVRERLERQLQRRAKELGYELKKVDAAAEAEQ